MDFVVLEQIKHLQELDKENTYYIIVAKRDDKCLQESDNVKIVELDCPTWLLPTLRRQQNYPYCNGWV